MARNTKPKPKYQCSAMVSEECKNEDGFRSEYNFYKSNGISSSHFGIAHICKNCLCDIIGYDPKTMELSLNQLIHALHLLDKPFISKVWESAQKEDRDKLGIYLKNLAFGLGKGNHDMTFLDGEINILTSYDEQQSEELLKDIKITEEMTIRWGSTRDAEDIKWLERYYQKMKEAYNVTYPTHLKQLESICNLSLEIQKLENSGKLVTQAKNYKPLNDSLNSLLSSSGLRPIDQKAGQNEGLSSYSQGSEYVERYGKVPPVQVDVPRDDIDKAMLILLNGYREVNNKPKIDTLSTNIEDIDAIGFDDIFGDDNG